mmetsp:Transcript_12611/g.35442  ORF Transcript_12611/g.35442 Transcript_12611/m.35442 type:complete len:1100 (-) Transcript_12611:133-3432(-)
MLVLVAHNGRTLELDVQGSTRVEAVQHALASLSGLPTQDQILIHNGVRLDSSKALAAYDLPHRVSSPRDSVADTRHQGPVFLYSRSWLRPDRPPHASEPLPEILVDEPTEAATTPGCPHPLDDPQLPPELQALPSCERGFKHHLAAAQAVWNASHERTRLCKRLLSEQEVQRMAIDAARANVEVHYRYIRKAFASFMDKYTPLQQAQREVLLNFDHDMKQLAQTELHPAAVQKGRKHLVDLVPTDRLQAWASNCRTSREQFAMKVSELEKIFSDLQVDVEGLLMKAPGTDLDNLGRQMELVDGRLCEEASILQKLQNNYNEVRRKVEETVKRLAACHASGLVPDTFCRDLDTINGVHQQELAKMRACDAEVEAFLRRCVETKNEMTCEVHEQLTHISAQQSRIRDMRNKLAVFQEVASKQGETFAELCLVGRIPAAYRACLAEVVRRRAFQELYAGQAAQLAERMAALREREAKRHEAFRAYVDPFIPPDLQAQLGLLLPPPLCEVNIPSCQEGSLADVTMEDIQGRPIETRPSQLVARVFQQWLPSDQKRLSQAQDPEAPATGQVRKETTYEDLQLQNARLRADLATFKAAAHLQAMKAEPPTAWPQGGGLSSVRASSPASTSQLLGTSHHAAGAGASSASPTGSPTASSSTAPAAASSSLPSGSGIGGLSVSDEKTQSTFLEALAAKDALVQQLQARLGAQEAQLESYSQRIASLENSLQAMSQPSMACTAAAESGREFSGPLHREEEGDEEGAPPPTSTHPEDAVVESEPPQGTGGGTGSPAEPLLTAPLLQDTAVQAAMQGEARDAGMQTPPPSHSQCDSATQAGDPASQPRQEEGQEVLADPPQSTTGQPAEGPPTALVALEEGPASTPEGFPHPSPHAASPPPPSTPESAESEMADVSPLLTPAEEGTEPTGTPLAAPWAEGDEGGPPRSPAEPLGTAVDEGAPLSSQGSFPTNDAVDLEPPHQSSSIVVEAEAPLRALPDPSPEPTRVSKPLHPERTCCEDKADPQPPAEDAAAAERVAAPSSDSSGAVEEAEPQAEPEAGADAGDRTLVCGGGEEEVTSAEATVAERGAEGESDHSCSESYGTAEDDNDQI